MCTYQYMYMYIYVHNTERDRYIHMCVFYMPLSQNIETMAPPLRLVAELDNMRGKMLQTCHRMGFVLTTGGPSK